MNCNSHCLLVVFTNALLFFVAVPQEDWVVHCYRKLKNCRQRFGNEWNLTHKVVTAHIYEDSNRYTCKEHKRDNPVIHKDHHCNYRKDNSDCNISHFLFLKHILHIRNHCRHTRNKALLTGNRTDFFDSVHCFISWCWGIEEYRHHRCISRIERIINFVGQHFLWNWDVGKIVIPKNRINMVDFFDFFLRCRNILIIHILKDEEWKSTLSKVIKQIILTLDCVEVIGKITKNVVINPCKCHSQGWRNHQRNGKYKDYETAFNNRFP